MNRKGFTLLEVMLALTIFALAMTALVGFHARGYVNDGKARRLTAAVSLARAKMTDIELDIEKEMVKGSFPEDRSESGEFEKPYEDYKWKMEIRRVELPIPPLGDNAGEINQQMMQMVTKQISDAVREIKLTISWQEMNNERSFSVVKHIVKM